MSRNLSKVQKSISKKRGNKPTALHENSRDAQRLRRAGARQDKLARLMTVAARQQQTYVDRTFWFQSILADLDGEVDDGQLCDLTNRYIHRDDEELAEIKKSRRPGRPQSKAEEQLNERLDTEEREFKSGFWVVDIRNAEVREKLERWAGEWAGLNSLGYVRVTKAGEVKASSFPPKALS